MNVFIYDYYFSPKSITIPLGTAVTWVNKGQEIHNVTGDWGGFMDLKPGTWWVVPFADPRDVGKTLWYYDEYYPDMRGSVTVLSS